MTKFDRFYCLLTLALACWQVLVAENYAHAAFFIGCSIWFKIPFKSNA